MAPKKPKKLPPFKHEPLDTSKQQIRLLNFSRIRKNGAIHCSISVHPISSAPSYRALSYTWGPPEPSYDIVIDNKTLRVRANLYAFLGKCTKSENAENVKELVNTPYFWIDQISIDQDNVAERNHQVRLMAEIYKRAAVVTIWLGESVGPKCDAGLSVAEHDELWTAEAIAEILKDSYFSRLWIVQEVLLNPKIEVRIRGDAQLGFDTLLTAKYFWRRRIRELGVPRSTLDLIDRYYTSGPRFGQVRQLHWLVQQFSGNQCADLRDKVYGLVGMCDVTQSVVVDYSKCTQEVFADVAMAFWLMFRRTRRAAAKVRLPLQYYNRVLEGLSREMIVEQQQRTGVAAMLKDLWTRMLDHYLFGDELPIRDMPVITAVGFKAKTMEGQRTSSVGPKPTALDQWWYVYSDQRWDYDAERTRVGEKIRAIFECSPPGTEVRRRTEPA